MDDDGGGWSKGGSGELVLPFPPGFPVFVFPSKKKAKSAVSLLLYAYYCNLPSYYSHHLFYITYMEGNYLI